ncbi:phospholipase D-like domain-containing protein [Nocardioides sp. HM23]|uniref:phospholipase D-like domain-containing protein n=1 Tax=Nocardioides bizhenqiangii TaxID=3095076 RepID=UPI002ACAB0B8|nr:phospholipase D-like domain-containing protein [Nocardioides sp. HM23]MDZ5622103.1 phospholipase D-like domain-containing protein [Nocardioides sp. HM23]
MIRWAATLAVLLPFLAGPTMAPAAGGLPQAAKSEAQDRAFTVAPRMTMSDPIRSRGNVARQLRTYIEHAPRGSTISIMSFFLSSSITWPALRAAYRRGVNIRAVLYGGPDGRPIPVSWEGARLTEMIRAGRARGRRGSWVVWTRKTARGNDIGNSAMHAKVWQFSRVGRTRKVTMIGSYNNGDPPDSRSYSAMVTLPGPELYDPVQRIFQVSAKDRYVGGNPQRRKSGDGWDLYFFPSTPITRANDPVLERLRSIPARSGTRMTIAMYSWQGFRGAWLARKLAAMVEAGARLTAVVGPDVARSVVRTLREAGARLEDGCWRTGRRSRPYVFTHNKEMTATWVEDGTTRYAAWLGSDDWGNGGGGSQSDQVTIGLYSRWAYNRLNKLLGPQIAHEPDNLAPCDPL